MMNWQSKNKELEQISISAIGRSMDELKTRKKREVDREQEHQHQMF